MLCLSRRRNETVIIDLNRISIDRLIELRNRGELRFDIMVTDVRGDKAKLGIDAPKDIPVHRQEVFDAIERQTTKPAA